MRVRAALRRTAVAVLFAAAPAAAMAQSPRGFAFFGDSFVDAGNLSGAAAALGIPFPYPSGRVSDGAVFSEILASSFGRASDGQARLFDLRNRNYAIAGATSGTANVIADRFGPGFAGQAGLSGQIPGFLADAARSGGTSGTMAVLFVGANDLLAPSPNPAALSSNVFNALNALYVGGVRQFLVPTLPDLSRTPRAAALTQAERDALSAGIAAYNSQLLATVNSFDQLPNTRALGLRLDNLFANVLNDPARYGFSNVAAPCVTTPAACATSLFFDDLHPTTAAHELVANAARERILRGVDVMLDPAVVPEPGTLALLGAGLVGVGAAARRRRAAA